MAVNYNMEYHMTRKCRGTCPFRVFFGDEAVVTVADHFKITDSDFRERKRVFLRVHTDKGGGSDGAAAFGEAFNIVKQQESRTQYHEKKEAFDKDHEPLPDLPKAGPPIAWPTNPIVPQAEARPGPDNPDRIAQQEAEQAAALAQALKDFDVLFTSTHAVMEELEQLFRFYPDLFRNWSSAEMSLAHRPPPTAAAPAITDAARNLLETFKRKVKLHVGPMASLSRLVNAVKGESEAAMAQVGEVRARRPVAALAHERLVAAATAVTGDFDRTPEEWVSVLRAVVSAKKAFDRALEAPQPEDVVLPDVLSSILTAVVEVNLELAQLTKALEVVQGGRLGFFFSRSLSSGFGGAPLHSAPPSVSSNSVLKPSLTTVAEGRSQVVTLEVLLRRAQELECEYRDTHSLFDGLSPSSHAQLTEEAVTLRLLAQPELKGLCETVTASLLRLVHDVHGALWMFLNNRIAPGGDTFLVALERAYYPLPVSASRSWVNASNMIDLERLALGVHARTTEGNSSTSLIALCSLWTSTEEGGSCPNVVRQCGEFIRLIGRLDSCLESAWTLAQRNTAEADPYCPALVPSRADLSCLAALEESLSVPPEALSSREWVERMSCVVQGAKHTDSVRQSLRDLEERALRTAMARSLDEMHGGSSHSSPPPPLYIEKAVREGENKIRAYVDDMRRRLSTVVQSDERSSAQRVALVREAEAVMMKHGSDTALMLEGLAVTQLAAELDRASEWLEGEGKKPCMRLYLVTDLTTTLEKVSSEVSAAKCCLAEGRRTSRPWSSYHEDFSQVKDNHGSVKRLVSRLTTVYQSEFAARGQGLTMLRNRAGFTLEETFVAALEERPPLSSRSITATEIAFDVEASVRRALEAFVTEVQPALQKAWRENEYTPRERQWLAEVQDMEAAQTKLSVLEYDVRGTWFSSKVEFPSFAAPSLIFVHNRVVLLSNITLEKQRSLIQTLDSDLEAMFAAKRFYSAAVREFLIFPELAAEGASFCQLADLVGRQARAVRNSKASRSNDEKIASLTEELQKEREKNRDLEYRLAQPWWDEVINSSWEHVRRDRPRIQPPPQLLQRVQGMSLDDFFDDYVQLTFSNDALVNEKNELSEALLDLAHEALALTQSTPHSDVDSSTRTAALGHASNSYGRDSTTSGGGSGGSSGGGSTSNGGRRGGDGSDDRPRGSSTIEMTERDRALRDYQLGKTALQRHFEDLAAAQRSRLTVAPTVVYEQTPHYNPYTAVQPVTREPTGYLSEVPHYSNQAYFPPQRQQNYPPNYYG